MASFFILIAIVVGAVFIGMSGVMDGCNTGGHYDGGVGSSHRGGHYDNPSTDNHYQRRK